MLRVVAIVAKLLLKLLPYFSTNMVSSVTVGKSEDKIMSWCRSSTNTDVVVCCYVAVMQLQKHCRGFSSSQAKGSGALLL